MSSESSRHKRKDFLLKSQIVKLFYTVWYIRDTHTLPTSPKYKNPDFSYVQLSAALNGLSRLLALPWFGQTLSALCRRCL